MQPWERINRTTLVDTPFLKVYNDEVKLPSGAVIDDYTVVRKRDIVVVVATDNNGQLLVFDEYKYAADQALLSLPAGQVDGDESKEDAAARELLEETGYGGGTFEVIDTLFEYPTKDLHTITVVRAKNASWQKDIVHEATENIGTLQLLSISDVKTRITRREWKVTAILAALMIALPELLEQE